MKLSGISMRCNLALMSVGSGLEAEKPEKMTDRHFSHPLTVDLATRFGTAGILFQFPFPLHSHIHKMS